MSLLIKNALILTPDTEIKSGYIGIDGDTIDYISAAAPEKRYDREKDMAGKLIMPGLINAHTHAAMTLLRGVGSDKSLQDWLFGSVVPIEDKLTPEDIRVGSELAIMEMLAGGVTSFSDMYFSPMETVKAVLSSGMKANINRPVQSFDPEERGEDSYRVREAIELYEAANGLGGGRVLIDFCVHAEYTCNERVTRYLSDIVRARGGNLHIHLSETKKEQLDCIDKYGKTPAMWFNDLGAFDSGAFAAHCVWLDDRDFDIFREKGVKAVHNPTSNMKLGSGFTPVQRMLDEGITVALGTDGTASNNNLDMFEEMPLASVIHNGFSGDPTIMKPADVIKMATVNGARVQRRDDTGELAVGKKADMIAIDLDRPHLTPNLDTRALVCYSAHSSDVVMTMVNGNILYENGEFLTIDRERVMHETRKTVERLYN